jgi:hypothetical protein
MLASIKTSGGSASQLGTQVFDELNSLLPEEAQNPPAMLPSLLSGRNPIFVTNSSRCQRIYYSENALPPTSAGESFEGNVRITIRPKAPGKSSAVTLFQLSDRRSEAEVLFPPTAKFIVEDMRVQGRNQDVIADQVQGKLPNPLDIELYEIRYREVD